MTKKGAKRLERRGGLDPAPTPRTPFSESYRDVVELAPVGIYTSTLEGRFLAVNASMARMLGYDSAEELLAIDIPRDLYFDTDERARVLSQYEQGTGIVRVETVLKRKDGSPVVIQFDSRVVRDAGGRTLGYEGFAHDITERKRTEEELRRSEERFRALVENSSEVIGLFDRDGRWLYASPSVERLWGYTAQEMLATKTFGERVHPEDIEQLRRNFQALVSKPDGIDTLEFRARHKDGSWRAFETIGVNRLETPGVRAIVANLRDVTARRQAEAALKESEERFRTLIERAPISIGIARYGLTIYANEAYQKMFGFRSIDELRGRPIAEQWAPQCRPEIEERARRRGLGLPVATEYEAIGQRKDGSQFPVHAAATLVQLADGPANIGFLSDITDRKRAEEQRTSILERVSDAFVALDTDWRYTYLNTKAAQIFGRQRDELVGKHIWTEFPEGIGQPFYKAYYRAAQEQVAVELEEYYPPYDRWFENRIYPSQDGLSIFFRDITERKQGEQRLQRSYEELRALAARMETVREEESSRIARELHDEIGQALTAIKIHLQTLQRRADAAAVAADLSESIGMAERALQQVRNLSLDLRPSVLDDLGLAAALRWYLDRQARLSGFAAEFAELSTDLPPVRLPRELETACFRVVQQALTNVAQHARARNVRVELRRKDGDLSISIRDDGVGFDVAAARAQARGGRSLGILGMEERVLLLKGAFEVRSEPAGGAEVFARFPLAPPPAGAA